MLDFSDMFLNMIDVLNMLNIGKGGGDGTLCGRYKLIINNVSKGGLSGVCKVIQRFLKLIL